MEFRHAIYRLYDEEHVSERKIAQMLGLSLLPCIIGLFDGENRPRPSRVDLESPMPTRIKTYTRLLAKILSKCCGFTKGMDSACSVDTVRNRLKQKGLKCRTPP
ncbi:hypothetical protein TNCT_617401 [Trichonephila clavata]|uniref:Transposase n=1 Tax=Trichonephila clavata TaxID=2740835 RepID=A0A8X6HQU1_TRICU|nr:hypothetical protein TNCT_617401 [Trichonephila clavata]